MKKYLKYILPVVVLVGALIIVNQLHKPNVTIEAKAITLEFVVNIEDDNSDLGSITVKSKAEDDLLLLGDVIDRLNEEHQEMFNVTLSGEKTDTFGRFVLGINDYITQDMATGPWWGYDSTTNKACLEAGFCSGIDEQPVDDGDVFTFTFATGF